MIAQHKKERLIADQVSGLVYSMPKTLLSWLDGKCYLPTHRQDPIRVLLQIRSKPAIDFIRRRCGKEMLKCWQVSRTDNDNDLFEP